MGVYIELFHGRKPRNQRLDDWGTPGPVFGPFGFIQTTYAHHIKMGDGGNCEADLHVDEDLVFYDGVWYGDWSVFDKLEDGHKSRIQKFDPKKAVVPDHEEGRSECQNCGKEWDDFELVYPRALNVRVAPGEPMPAGECPACGALCQPI